MFEEVASLTGTFTTRLLAEKAFHLDQNRFGVCVEYFKCLTAGVHNGW